MVFRLWVVGRIQVLRTVVDHKLELLAEFYPDKGGFEAFMEGVISTKESLLPGLLREFTKQFHFCGWVIDILGVKVDICNEIA